MLLDASDSLLDKCDLLADMSGFFQGKLVALGLQSDHLLRCEQLRLNKASLLLRDEHLIDHFALT